MIGKRFRALHLVSDLLKVLAFCLGGLGIVFGLVLVIGSIAGMVMARRIGLLSGVAGVIGIVYGSATIIGALLGMLITYAVAEWIDLHLSLEEHGRTVAVLTRLGSSEQLQRQEQMLEEATLTWD